MADPFLAEVRVFGFNFAPSGWALCNGQTISISQNTALFSLIGTYYGGDGRSNFQLPNLQSRAPMFWQQGPGLSDYVIGEMAGSETVTLLTTEIPLHNHPLTADDDDPISSDPTNRLIANSETNVFASGTPNTTMSPVSTTVTGGSLAHNNVQPYLTVNFCIAMRGIFPARN